MGSNSATTKAIVDGAGPVTPFTAPSDGAVVLERYVDDRFGFLRLESHARYNRATRDDDAAPARVAYPAAPSTSERRLDWRLGVCCSGGLMRRPVVMAREHAAARSSRQDRSERHAWIATPP